MKSIQDAHSDYLRTIDSTGSVDTDQDNFFNKKRRSIPVNEKTFSVKLDITASVSSAITAGSDDVIFAVA